ncbi:MAG TPA: CHASE3 domain-containing protein, partial [Puia sp.]|nr:CHASE3 domain-containing protein [Puia sp.]
MKIASRPGILRNLQIGFGLSLLLLIITSVASYSSIRNLLDSSQWVDHTDSVLIKIDRVNTLLRDAESAQRGYLLTGDIDFLPAFNVVQAQIGTVVDSITAMTSDNPRQTENIRELKQYVFLPIPMLKHVIDQKKAEDKFDPAE